MKIVVTADFHGTYPEIPECDLLLIAGDVGLQDRQDVFRFEEWLLRVPAEVVVGIAGNCDSLAASRPFLVRDLPWIYLQDDSIVVEGIMIHGSPWSVENGMWPFQKPDLELADKWAKIPDDVDILMTHGPPYGILDRSSFGNVNCGSRTLLTELGRLQSMRLHVFGHIHEARGMEIRGSIFANVATGLIFESEEIWPSHAPTAE